MRTPGQRSDGRAASTVLRNCAVLVGYLIEVLHWVMSLVIPPTALKRIAWLLRVSAELWIDNGNKPTPKWHYIQHIPLMIQRYACLFRIQYIVGRDV